MSKIQDIIRLYDQLRAMGFTLEEAQALRRIEMTLSRWNELECGDGNEYGSWAIERDEETEKPFMVHHHYLHGRGKDYVTHTAIADRESGALKRLAKIVAARNAREADAVVPYHQGDPRGCSLYIVRQSDIPPDGRIDSYYTRGIGVAA